VHLGRLTYKSLALFITKRAELDKHQKLPRD
jgi:hypothetical protein